MTTSEIVEAVYVHVPFCRSLCGYCDFYSIVPSADVFRPWTDALLVELECYRKRIGLRVKTIYVGGGTPTSLPLAELARLVDALPAVEPVEFTVEANPATITDDTAALLADRGVNRVSIGAQSFDERELGVLERIHGPDEIGATVALCRRHGIEQISLDLIFGIPGQTSASWGRSLEAALALNPDHLSCYSLTYEPGTRLYESLIAGTVTRADPDLDADLYEQTIDTLTRAGYEHYEISNFARSSRRCRHNLVYWRNEPYLGVGPSAAGYLDRVRYKNVADVEQYVRKIAAGTSPRDEEEHRDLEGEMRDTAMLGLRTTDGMNRRRFQERFGSDPSVVFEYAIARNRERGLIEVTDNYVHLTRAGILLADQVIADFL